MNDIAITAVVTFVFLLIGFPILFGFARLFGIYTTVQERQCKVYVLFGKVIGQLDEPGLHFLIPKLGLKAIIVNISGRCYTLDMRLDQEYLRSQAVNSEEGAPMGIGVCMRCSSVIRRRIFLRMPTHAARSPPTWATPPSAV